MDFDWLNPQIKNRFIHTDLQALRKCCGCIHLRVGAAFSCIVWAALSMYFAVLSFQDKSPFYSYMSSPPLIVYGVVNLFLVIVALLGLLALFRNRWEYIRHFSHATWVAIFAFLVDGLINVILFFNSRPDFQAQCVEAAASNLNATALAAGGTNATSFDLTSADYYNCDKLWEDEAKFGLMSICIMVVIYIYWAACIYSFSHKQGAANLAAARMMPPPGAAPGMVPPPGAPAPATMPPPTAAPINPADRSNIIVLNNEKPSRKTKKKNNTISLSRKLRKIEPSSLLFGFSISPDGRVTDLEQANPYMLDTKRLKRKSVPNLSQYYKMEDDDENDDDDNNQWEKYRRRSTDK
ncbi:hypothetical protein VTP01DRAFT_8501 [Rhizomucor pusillus]|uniref:uncharacterized protein n=1 Tax=Rhizomucor pusillus TaxID=4840 RepID=UPI003744543D